MAFPRPTLPALIDDLRAAFRTEFTAAGRQLEAYVRHTTTWILTRVWGDALHNLYGLLAWATNQVVPSLADEAYLLEHGKTWGMAPLPAVASAGGIVVTGVDGTVIPSDRQLVRSDGVLYATTASGTIAGGTLTLAAVCLQGGASGNMGPLTALSFVSPIAGVTAVTTSNDADDWSVGADLESVEAFRERLLLRTSRPPQGGASVDYQQWARLVAGVTRVWVAPLARGAGTVDVYFLHEEGTGIGIPTGGQVSAVQAAIDARRPVTADALALAPAEVPVAFQIAITPDTVENRALVTAELDALFLLKAGSGQTIYLSDYWGALTGLIGAGLDTVDLVSPASPTVVTTAQVAVRGVVTWL